MQWSPAAAVALAALLVASGAAVPVAAAPAPERPTAAPALTDGSGAGPSAQAGLADPPSDVLGWEAGYWHNESIDVNQTDGVDPAELNATVARSMARVEVVRGLEFVEPVPVEIETRESFQAEQANRSTDPTLATFDNEKFEALLLIGEDEDSIAVQNENAGTSILGFYSPSRNAIVLISENPSDLQIDEMTLAHELVHALQDQHFNLSRYDARTRDGANAESGLIEGDARLVELRYGRECDPGGRWNDSCVAPPASFEDGGSGSLANVGVQLLKYQPYSDGPKFLTEQYDEGGWAAVNAVYEEPPASSEQVIHPERYRDDPPTRVMLRDRNATTWSRVRPPDRPDYGSVGEAGVFTMLWYPGYHSQLRTQIVPYESFLNRTDGGTSSFQPYLYDSPYSAGWDGDRLHVYERDNGQTAYVWRLAWDTPSDARQFVRGYYQALEYWGGERVAPNTWVVHEGPFADAFHVSVDGDEVTIVNAPTVRQLPEVRQGVEVTPTPSPTASPTADVNSPSPRGASGGSGGSDGSHSPPSADPTTSPGQAGFGALAALASVLVGLLARRLG